MNKSTSASATLRELWMIKDATAARFKSAAEYFEYLQAPLEILPSRTKSVLKTGQKLQSVKAKKSLMSITTP